MIVFCSDNGPVENDGYKDEALEEMGDHKPAGPYRVENTVEAERAHLSSPTGREPVSLGFRDEMVCTIDLATSLANHLNVSIPKDACLDSLDVMNALLGKERSEGTFPSRSTGQWTRKQLRLPRRQLETATPRLKKEKRRGDQQARQYSCPTLRPGRA